MSYQPQANGQPWTVQTTKIVFSKNVGRTGLQYLPDFFLSPGLTFSFSTTGIEFSELIIGGRDGGGDKSRPAVMVLSRAEVSLPSILIKSAS